MGHKVSVELRISWVLVVLEQDLNARGLEGTNIGIVAAKRAKDVSVSSKLPTHVKHTRRLRSLKVEVRRLHEACLNFEGGEEPAEHVLVDFGQVPPLARVEVLKKDGIVVEVGCLAIML